MPKRIQLSRKKGWRKPKDAIVVSRPSRWGNPYKSTDYVASRYLPSGELNDDPPTKRKIRRELRGKDLCCWCPLPEPGQPDHCHAAVLLEIANEAPTEESGER